jgi:MFS family permease
MHHPQLWLTVSVCIESHAQSVPNPFILFLLGRVAPTSVDCALLAAYTCGNFLTGCVVKHGGRKLPLVASFAFAGALTALCARCSSVWAMAACWGGSGLFAACSNPLLLTHLAEVLPASSRSTLIGIWSTSSQVGGVLANLFNSFTLQHSGWRLCFHRSGLVVLCFAPLMAMFVHPNAASTTASSFNGGGTPRRQQETRCCDIPGAASVCVACERPNYSAIEPGSTRAAFGVKRRPLGITHLLCDLELMLPSIHVQPSSLLSSLPLPCLQTRVSRWSVTACSYGHRTF